MNGARSLQCLSIVFLLSWAGGSAAHPPAKRHVRLDFHCEMSSLPDGAQTVDLWIPMFTTNERQDIKLLNESDLRDGRMTKDKVFGNQLYYRRFVLPTSVGKKEGADSGLPIRVKLVYDAEVREASVGAAKQLISTNPAVPAEKFAPYLGDSRLIPIRGPITDLARQIPLPEGEPLRAARKVYDYLVDTMSYNYLAPGAGKGDAVWACNSKTGDCSDFNSIFIGVCRWRGIPADHVFGPPIPSEKREGDSKFCHCWAQFWVVDVGWTPVDPSRANKYPRDREYYFGTLGSTWITLAHGRDVVLEPPQKGPPLNMLHGPVAEVDGKPFEGLRWWVHYKDQ